jgi:hypothetical protein
MGVRSTTAAKASLIDAISGECAPRAARLEQGDGGLDGFSAA